MDIYLLRDGQDTGPFDEQTLHSMLEQGTASRNDLAWIEGRASWDKLAAVLDLDSPSQVLPPFEWATARQKAFLSYVDIAFSSRTTKEEAAILMNEAMENPKLTARLLQWNDDRLRLHPDLFAAEVEAKKEARPNRYFEACQREGADRFTGVTKAHCQVLVSHLDLTFPNWDAKESEAVWDYFFPAVAEKFPELVRKEWRGKLKFPGGPRVAREVLESQGGIPNRPHRVVTARRPWLPALVQSAVIGLTLLLAVYSGLQIFKHDRGAVEPAPGASNPAPENESAPAKIGKPDEGKLVQTSVTAPPAKEDKSLAIKKEFSDLVEKGAKGFPQKEAQVVCDDEDLRVSVCIRNKSFIVQAVLWTDDDDSVVAADANPAIGDRSSLSFDLDLDHSANSSKDRAYFLNPYPGMSDLYLKVGSRETTSTDLKPVRNEQVGGLIEYPRSASGKRVRVDTYSIPIADVSRNQGESVRFCYCGHSPKPRMTVNSAGFDAGGKDYYDHEIPLTYFHEYYLPEAVEIDPTKMLTLVKLEADRPGFPRLKESGAFGFRQDEAKKLYDSEDLRLSVWNNKTSLVVQAVMWTDGTRDDHGEIRDRSDLAFELDATHTASPGIDRVYSINPLPKTKGLFYLIRNNTPTTSSGLRGDSYGFGVIKYLESTDGKKVRVDTYSLPISEVSKNGADRVRFCYCGNSPNPPLAVNSIGYASGGKTYSYSDIPYRLYHDYPLSGRKMDDHEKEVMAGPRRNDPAFTLLSNNGGFGFPQKESQVIYDTPDLRLSVWADAYTMKVQAIVWNDDDAALGEPVNGKAEPDRSRLLLDVNADKNITARTDRRYLLNPPPDKTGLFYQVYDGGLNPPLKNDSKGKAAIEYWAEGGKTVRVDTYTIPLVEIGKQWNQKIRLCYVGESPKPKLIVKSESQKPGDISPMEPDSKISLSKYLEFTLGRVPGR